MSKKFGTDMETTFQPAFEDSASLDFLSVCLEWEPQDLNINSPVRFETSIEPCKSITPLGDQSLTDESLNFLETFDVPDALEAKVGALCSQKTELGWLADPIDVNNQSDSRTQPRSAKRSRSDHKNDVQQTTCLCELERKDLQNLINQVISINHVVCKIAERYVGQIFESYLS